MTAGRAKKQAKKEKLKAALQARAAHARAARKAIRESAFYLYPPSAPSLFLACSPVTCLLTV